MIKNPDELCTVLSGIMQILEDVKADLKEGEVALLPNQPTFASRSGFSTSCGANINHTIENKTIIISKRFQTIEISSSPSIRLPTLATLIVCQNGIISGRCHYRYTKTEEECTLNELKGVECMPPSLSKLCKESIELGVQVRKAYKQAKIRRV